MMRKPSRQIALLLLPMLLCGQAIGQTSRPALMPEGESKFLRFVPDDKGGGALQTSVVTYRNAAGATVDLIAAVHVADAAFFHDLQKSFEQYDSLLYEMVKPKEMDAPTRPRPGQGQRPLSWVSTLQQMMKNVLELSFQLEEIDYTKPNFVHADLDVDTFFQKQEERGESMLTLMLQAMMRELARENPRPYEPGLADLLFAMQQPDRARQLKLILARQFNQIDEIMAGMEGPDGSVIVGERNKAALKVLKERLDKGQKKFGIFYGAAHLKGMEKILTEEMGFKQVGEPRWKTAWDMKSAPTTRPATVP